MAETLASPAWDHPSQGQQAPLSGMEILRLLQISRMLHVLSCPFPLCAPLALLPRPRPHLAPRRIETHLVNVSSGADLHRGVARGILDHKMGHLACFSGGMIAGAEDAKEEKRAHYRELAAQITKTCHESYAPLR